MSDQRNLIFAVALSAAVLFTWQYVFVPTKPVKTAEQGVSAPAATTPAGTPALAPAPAGAAPTVPTLSAAMPREQALTQTARVNVATPTLDGSINLTGARFDDLKLRKYRATVDPDSAEIELLTPSAAAHPYYAEFGWIAPAGNTMPVPDPSTPWTVTQGSTLAPGQDVVLTYDDGQGLVFTRRVSVDEQYMFTITDTVANNAAAPVVLYPYGLVSRHDVPKAQRYWVVHEGFIGVANGSLQDPSYDDLGKNNDTKSFESTGGWVGITDKYWMAAVIPPQSAAFTGTYKAYDLAGTKAYQSDYLMKPVSIAPGGSQSVTHHMFAGAKVVSIVDSYRDKLGIVRFDRAVDWGWFFYLTKPIFLAIDYIYTHITPNFGIAILIFTFLLKLLFFPLANTSYRAMSKMKKLQPEMERLKERHKEDKAAQQQAIMQLYQKEKVNPLAGCLPMLIQIPVFFSLYKVLFVTIEMRHAPFFGWIRDLSAPDPTSLFNLFGLIPITLPSFLMIGVFPLLMGVTMWVQTNLNPPPADPVQQKIFQFMPLIFTVMLANFAVGLVIYWTWNNMLTILQQLLVMKQTGTPIDLLDRIYHRKVKSPPA